MFHRRNLTNPIITRIIFTPKGLEECDAPPCMESSILNAFMTVAALRNVALFLPLYKMWDPTANVSIYHLNEASTMQ